MKPCCEMIEKVRNLDIFSSLQAIKAEKPQPSSPITTQSSKIKVSEENELSENLRGPGSTQ